MLTLKEAETIYCYLCETKQEFCFYEGRVISRNQCLEIISGASLTAIICQ